MLFRKLKKKIQTEKFISIKSTGRPRLKLNEIAIKKEYENGMTIAELARKYKCSETTIRRRIGL